MRSMDSPRNLELDYLQLPRLQLEEKVKQRQEEAEEEDYLLQDLVPGARVPKTAAK